MNDVAVERRAVFLADDQQRSGVESGCGPPPGHEELVVQNAVVLVGDLLVDHVLVSRPPTSSSGSRACCAGSRRNSCARGSSRCTSPSPTCRSSGSSDHGHRLISFGLDLDFRLSPASTRSPSPPPGSPCRPAARTWNSPRGGTAGSPAAGDARVGVGRRVELAVGRRQVDPRGGVAAWSGVHRPHRQARPSAASTAVSSIGHVRCSPP